MNEKFGWENKKLFFIKLEQKSCLKCYSYIYNESSTNKMNSIEGYII